MRYGKIYKFLIIAIGICIVLSIIQKQRNSSNVIRETIASPQHEIYKDVSLTKETGKEQIKTKETEVTETTETKFEYPDISEIVPEESLSPENYTLYEDDIQTDCYFVNTENTIDVTGILPLYAQGTLVEATQIWLNQNGYGSGEIKCLDGTVQRTEEQVTFQGESENMIIVFTYSFDSKTWRLEKG